MSKVVNLSLVKREREVSIEEAWNRFAALKKRSEETLSVEDGIAAGKAYAAFCELFLPRKAS